MNILAIDTATESCSVAVATIDTIIETYEVAPQQHANLVLKQIDKTLKNAGLELPEIDVLAFGRGPGSFTGVRIAASVIQAIATATDKPIAAVSNLQALAQLAYRTQQCEHVVAAIDARMQEVYWASYVYDQKTQLMQEASSEQVSKVEDLAANYFENYYLIGSGWDAFQDQIRSLQPNLKINAISHQLPHAYDIALIAKSLAQQNQLITAAQALPSYLRNNVAKKKGS